ncbi:MAG: ATP-binding cassette domain-containing protein [Bryobacteraceae bacterium]|nr:ATP-binding cassette domain-containing protein [Bryobacteraceae bacterium]
MDAQILAVDGVSKRFQTVLAVDDLHFHVDRGEILALLGPNGAGKSTMVRMLVNILRPDVGTIRWSINGKAGQPGPADMGYLPEDRGLYKDQPVLRTLSYFGALRGMERKAAERAGLEWLERVGLKDRAKEKLDALSKGNQQKVQFVASILHAPPFAILDEPFSGLDPVNQELFVDMIRGLREQGTTILMNAHQMNLVERLADRMLLINRGRAVLYGSVEEIRRKASAGNKLTFRVREEADLAAVRAHPAVEDVETEGRTVHVLVRAEASLSDVLQFVAGRFEIAEVHSERMSLHDIFVRAVGESGVAAEGAKA